MDAPGHPAGVIAQNLGDLRRVNWLLGGVWLTLHGLRQLLPPDEDHRRTALRVVDAASGGADIPAAVARWCARRGVRCWLVASDFNLDIVREARRQVGNRAALVFLVADATRLPFGDGALDVLTSSLALHHMLPHEARRMLAEQRRCARRGVVLNDIRRNWLCYVGAYIATRLGSRNRLTWHDGPLSVRRAYTTAETRALLVEARLRPVFWRGFLGYRGVFVAVPDNA